MFKKRSFSFKYRFSLPRTPVLRTTPTDPLYGPPPKQSKNNTRFRVPGNLRRAPADFENPAYNVIIVLTGQRYQCPDVKQLV